MFDTSLGSPAKSLLFVVRILEIYKTALHGGVYRLGTTISLLELFVDTGKQDASCCSDSLCSPWIC